MSEHDINALHHAVKAMMKAQESNTKELRRVLGPIEALPSLFEKQMKAIEDGFHRQLEGIAQLEIAQKQADLMAGKAMIDNQQAMLREMAASYEEEFRKLSDRYRKLQEELNEQAESRVRELDGPALDLLTIDFREKLMGYYKDVTLPLPDLFHLDFVDQSRIREAKLGEYLENIVNLIDRFLGLRSAFFDKVSGVLLQGKVENVVTAYIPAYFVQLVDEESGTTTTEFFLDPKENAFEERMETLTARLKPYFNNYVDLFGKPMPSKRIDKILRTACEVLGDFLNRGNESKDALLENVQCEKTVFVESR